MDNLQEGKKYLEDDFFDASGHAFRIPENIPFHGCAMGADPAFDLPGLGLKNYFSYPIEIVDRAENVKLAVKDRSIGYVVATLIAELTHLNNLSRPFNAWHLGYTYLQSFKIADSGHPRGNYFFN